MQSEQVSWLRSRLPSKLSPLASLGSNLLPDALPPSSPPLLLHPSLSPYCKFLKFLAVVYLGIYASREFAMAHGSTWDEDLDMEEFVSHNLWSTLSDVALIYFLGRLCYRRGVDSLNFLFPMFVGSCLWELIGRVPDLSKNLSCISCWAPLTYAAFGSFAVRRSCPFSSSTPGACTGTGSCRGGLSRLPWSSR
jgi:hypothetical protein